MQVSMKGSLKCHPLQHDELHCWEPHVKTVWQATASLVYFVYSFFQHLTFMNKVLGITLHLAFMNAFNLIYNWQVKCRIPQSLTVSPITLLMSLFCDSTFTFMIGCSKARHFSYLDSRLLQLLLQWSEESHN